MTRIRSITFVAPALSLLLALACGNESPADGGSASDNGQGGDGAGAANGSGGNNQDGAGGSDGAGASTSGSGGKNGTGGFPGLDSITAKPDGTTGGGATPSGYAACADTSTLAELGAVPNTADNNGPDSHNSYYGAKPILIPAPRTDGSFDVAWQTQKGASDLYVTHVEKSGDVYKAAWHLEVPSLGIVAGLSITESGEPVLVTAVDEAIAKDVMPVEVHRPNIMQVVRVGSDCQESFREDLRTDFDGDSSRTPLYSPLTAGSARLAVGGGTYVLHYSQNTEYDEGVESRHQIGRYIVGSLTTGEVTAVQGNISHSFDQRLHYDGSDFLSLSLGDASHRGIALSRTTTAGAKTQRTLLAIKGGDGDTGGGYNNTFSRLGDVRTGESGYVSLFSTEEGTDDPERVSFSRNLGLVHSPKNFAEIDQPESYGVVISDTATGNDHTRSWDVMINDYWGKAFAGNNQQVAWLTDYDDRLTAHVERPKLVRYSAGAFYVLWEKWTLTTFEATYVALVDEWGNLLEEPVSLGSARLPRGDDAFLLDGNAAWLEGAGGKMILHLVTSALVHSTQEL